MKKLSVLFSFLSLFAAAQPSSQILLASTQELPVNSLGSQFDNSAYHIKYIVDKETGLLLLNDSINDKWLPLSNNILNGSYVQNSTLNISSSLLSGIVKTGSNRNYFVLNPEDYSGIQTLSNYILRSDSGLNVNESDINRIVYHPGVLYTSYQNRTEEFYKGKYEPSKFEFYDHELLNANGENFPLILTSVSSNLNSRFAAGENNGMYISKQAIYREDLKGTDNIAWASFNAPSGATGSSISLFTGVNYADANAGGSFVIDNGVNKFILGANKIQGTIGWEGINGTRLTLTSGLISTDAILQSQSSLRVINVNNSVGVSFTDNLQGYYISDMEGSTGIMVQNMSNGSSSSSVIYLKQQQTSNWIGTYSQTSNSDYYLPGSLVFQSQGIGGILINAATDFSGNSGPIRFGINLNEVARFTPQSFLIGTEEEFPCSILTMNSDKQGFMPPRLTSKQRKNISNPKEGLMVYDTNIKAICFWNGKHWLKFISEIAD
jgi:hypothetical protein